MPDTGDSVDIAIIGAGLAGLTLAMQLQQSDPKLCICVLEKSALPPPPAAHKVGEATVEIGAHYLTHTLNLQTLLERTQLRKFGLRLFFGSGAHADLAAADELGASSPLPAISYQLDRGLLEKDLLEILRARGVTVRDECRVTRTTVGDASGGHQLSFNDHGEDQTLRCRWLVDASARSAVLKRHLTIAKPSQHQMSAAWFRLDTSLSVDEWSTDTEWQQRCNGLSRKASTNHLMGCGYWAWIIPLVGGRSSVGLVSDPDILSLSEYDSFDRFRRFLGEHQPLLAERVDGAAAELMDFRKLNKLAQESERNWSADGWALSGECSLFADPFYSPGTDFIALSNTFITDLITRDCSATERSIRTSVYEKLYQSFYDSTMSLYRGQYPGFGDTRLMSIKLTWDYAYYWSILAWLFFRDVLTDLSFLRAAQNEIAQIRALNETVQATFRSRAAKQQADQGQGRFIDQIQIPILVELNAALLQPAADLGLELKTNCARLQRLAPMLMTMLANESAVGDDARDLLGDLERRLS